MTTKDGFSWDAETGLKSGLPCSGVLEAYEASNSSTSYDVIVIGAGFSGLVASRDLALRGILHTGESRVLSLSLL